MIEVSTVLPGMTSIKSTLSPPWTSSLTTPHQHWNLDHHFIISNNRQTIHHTTLKHHEGQSVYLYSPPQSFHHSVGRLSTPVRTMLWWRRRFQRWLLSRCNHLCREQARLRQPRQSQWRCHKLLTQRWFWRCSGLPIGYFVLQYGRSLRSWGLELLSEWRYIHRLYQRWRRLASCYMLSDIWR